MHCAIELARGGASAVVLEGGDFGYGASTRNGGGVSGGGRIVMVGVLIQQQVSELLDWNFAAAVSMLLLVASIAIYAAVMGLAGRLERHQ